MFGKARQNTTSGANLLKCEDVTKTTSQGVNVEIKNKLILAPLAGYTNQVYRQICHDLGAGLTYTEMITGQI